ncbi:hypothetical protein CgunFtcFv8_022608 [Champsocephalus gunnari]|uniref:Uncharacterized protein n=1 Tax=Champsocephalus gunnari TaxID=52237 RepID=A0AAN8DPY0_CHAGU|nr:hypothetical protein CgunFtcFv8_022608 [Champsocephalus gunnari]
MPRIELPQHPVCEEQVLSEQQLCIQERNSSLDQEDPEPPQIKEEQEELCTSPEGEQLGLEQDTDAFMLTATKEESEHQLLSHNSHVAESQDQEGATLNRHLRSHTGGDQTAVPTAGCRLETGNTNTKDRVPTASCL